MARSVGLLAPPARSFATRHVRAGCAVRTVRTNANSRPVDARAAHQRWSPPADVVQERPAASAPIGVSPTDTVLAVAPTRPSRASGEASVR
jgi:hypothetical protein